MITIQNARGWLNRLGQSHIGADANMILQQVVNDPCATGSVSLLREVIAACRLRRAEDALELPEVLIQAGTILYITGDITKIQEAWGYVNEAVACYNDTQIHRKATALWILGVIEKRLADHLSAYIRWNTAFTSFASLQKDAVAQQSQHAGWYTERVQDMFVALTETVEEAFTWYDRFDNERIRIPAHETSEQIARMLNMRMDGSLQNYIQSLRNTTRFASESREVSEGMFQAGVASYAKGDLAAAEKDLRVSLDRSAKDSHQRAVVMWTLGLVLFKVRGKEEEGGSMCQRAIDAFGELFNQAVNQKQRERVEWYREKRPLLEEVLRSLQREFLARLG